ncbi:maltase A1-like [Fopius arisanus]|uniref:alpha-glucosidase n=1 Tax=Fopius arisanus TaxID=64838 RepID=A0A9R1TCH6_9HYME|nr:PREDICTED: maltase A1-like [Fopius arisanus]XP_011306568.1 PREDICTED: maltase A1-like [Fopius arisanus]
MATGRGLALLALFLAVQTGSPITAADDWWKDTLIYEIGPRAFQDSDGDGNGDLSGIVQRLDYLQDLGVETICLNPIYPSPMIASGYDISNYTDIHPIFGDMEDFNRLVDEIHRREMKVILDIVPNHSSTEHNWFNESINRIDPYTDYYIWADGTVDANGTRHPPNDWTSFNGDENGSAWTWNDARGQWYYHKYHEAQPDLNLKNEDVVRELLDIIKFWLERGVDGFVFSEVRDLFVDPILGDEGSSNATTGSFESLETSNLLYEIREYTNNWTDLNNSTGKLLMVEASAPDEDLLSYYGSEERPGVVPVNFRLIEGIGEGATAGNIKLLIEGWLEKLQENWTTNWALSTDKYPRITSRVGDKKLRGYLILSMLLPGQAYTYYGDEIGMTDSKGQWNDTLTPSSPRLSPNSLEYSLNAPTAPMQWNEATSAGFSTNDTTYLPVNENYDYLNVERQLEDPESTLNMYKSLARLRKDPVFRDGDWEIEALNDEKILLLKRSLEGHPTYIILVNTGSERESVNASVYPDLQEELIIVLSTEDFSNSSRAPRDRIKLLPNAAMVLMNSEDNETIEEPFVDESTVTINQNTTDDDETTEEIPVDGAMNSSGEHPWRQWTENFTEDPIDEGDEKVENDSLSDPLTLKIPEIAPAVNNSEEIEEKPRTTSQPIHNIPERIETTTQTPKSLNNADDRHENSSACSNKIAKFVLGFTCSVALIFNYV